MIKGIIFDWDGVLIDSEPTFKRVEHSLLKTAWASAPSSVPADQVDEVIAGLIRSMSGMGAADALGMCRERLNLVPELGDLLIDYRARLDEAYPTSPMIPGALDLVRRLKPHTRLGLATSSGRRLIDPVLAGRGILPLFDTVVSADDVGGVAKPAPDVYLRAVEQLGLEPSDCVAIEDTAVGVIAATTAGCRCIAIPRRETVFADFSPAIRVARTLQDLSLEFLEDLDRTPDPDDARRPVAVYARSQVAKRADVLVHLQLEAGVAMARARGYRVVEKLFDIDHGLPWNERPGLGTILTLAEQKRIERIIVAEPYALAAASLHQARIVSTFLELDVRIESVFRKEPHAGVSGPQPSRN